mgnify:CR=1 FL=1
MALKKRLFVAVLGLLLGLPAMGQFTYGTTGLLHMPTADMQQDRTFMIGGGYLNKHATPSRWTYNTWNYYLNVTIFPWLEIAYTCTIFDEMVDRGVMIHMINQDRNFSGRLRVWKEGWLKEWTPQIVVGVNDFTTGAGTDYKDMAVEGNGNGYFNRYYIAATKHVSWYGKWGLHAAYVYNKRRKDKLNGPAIGVDYQFALPESSFFNKAINYLNLMAEYDSKFVNIGAKYTLWKDHINIIGELRDCKYPSVGVFFKVHLK